MSVVLVDQLNMNVGVLEFHHLVLSNLVTVWHIRVDVAAVADILAVDDDDDDDHDEWWW